MAKKLFFLLAGMVFVAVSVILCAIFVKPDQDLNCYDSLSSSFYQLKLELSPVKASDLGHHQFDSLLPNRTSQNYQTVRKTCESLSSSALKCQPSSPQQQFFLKVLLFETEACVKGIQSKAYLFSHISFTFGYPYHLSKWFSKPGYFKLDSIQDYDNVIQRLKKVKPLMEQTEMILKEGIKEGITLPKESLKYTDELFNPFYKKIDDNPLYGILSEVTSRGFDEFEVEVEAEVIQQQGQEVIEKEVIPAIKRLHDFINTEYVNHVRKTPGLLGIPNGLEMYQGCLDYSTTLPGLTAPEIHQIGLEEVKDLRKEVENVAIELGQPNLQTFQQLVSFLQSQPNQTFPSKESLLSHLSHLMHTKILPKMSEILPSTLLTPQLSALNLESAPAGSKILAFYEKASESRNGTVVANVDSLKRFELLSLMLHEGVPGHHLELSVFRQLYETSPQFMEAPPFDEYTTAPAAGLRYTAFLEGWALYAEYLGKELGLFDDPYDYLGYLGFNLLRSSRLVVDTGLHHFGWSAQRAVEYMLENTLLQEEVIVREIDRYVTMPGQATSYKIGERYIHQARANEEARLGEAFDLRSFHERVLACKGPIYLLEECITLKGIV